MKSIQIKPVFVKTKNVRNFEVLMDGLAMAAGEGRMGIVYGSAGRGKTRTAQWFAANNDCVYVKMQYIWRRSELDFLRAFCRELGVVSPPKRRGMCCEVVIDRLLAEPRPVFFDEIEKMGGDFLEILRDISEATGTAFVMIGEEELKGVMEVNKRVWSRTYRELEFDPMSVSDIMYYAKDAAGLALPPEVAGIFHKSSAGDFRIVKRGMITLVQFLNARGGGVDGGITEEMARIAMKMGLKG